MHVREEKLKILKRGEYSENPHVDVSGDKICLWW
jgi:hypothetical protein